MEQNNFEKNVQQKLDELKIPPSDAVWENVEKRIGKKHKDRKVIFILIFLLLFILSAGYWLFNSGKNSQRNQPVSNLIKSDSKQTNNYDSSLSKSVISSANNSEKRDLETVTAKKSKTEASQQSPIYKGDSGQNRITKKHRRLVKEDAFKSKEKALNSSENKSVNSNGTLLNGRQTNNEENEIVLNNSNNLSVKKPNASEIENGNENIDSTNNIQNKISNDSLLNQLKSKKISKEIVAKDDSSLKKHSEKKQKNRWAFGLSFSGGASLIGESLLGINNRNSTYFQSSPITSGSGGIGNGGTPSSYAPSAIENSFAFIGGAFMEKTISAKGKISLGISYRYFSLINKVGNRVDTSITFPSQNFSSSGGLYNSINNANTYRNNFHYLEIPVLLNLQLGKSKTLPVFWDAGINISQLISSNALQFTSNPGLYYNDNSLFNKTQIGLQTGFSAILFSNTKNPVSIGPYFIYNTSKLANEGLYGGKHFSFIGIKTEILFGKK